jgi:hypothetical protein
LEEGVTVAVEGMKARGLSVMAECQLISDCPMAAIEMSAFYRPRLELDEFMC